MKFATLDQNGIVTGLFTGPQSFETSQVPDQVDLGWVQVNSVWQKSQAQLNAESDAADRAAKRATVGAAVAALRGWADDAETAVAAWDGWTQTQKNAALKTTITRLGVFFDRFADLIQAQRMDQ